MVGKAAFNSLTGDRNPSTLPTYRRDAETDILGGPITPCVSQVGSIPSSAPNSRILGKIDCHGETAWLKEPRTVSLLQISQEGLRQWIHIPPCSSSNLLSATN
jgi:hypothetical protein